MDYLQALILGIVEGISEFLPISSTGHLILTSYVLGIPQTEFVKSFEVIIQLGAILSVVVLYFKTLLRIDIWKKILVAFIPSLILGGLFYPKIKEHLIGNPLIVVMALFTGGLLLIILELYFKKKGK